MCANNNNNEAPKKGLKSECTAYKYSNKGKSELYEAVILSGRPAFLKYENGKIVSVEQIEESSRIIKPPSAEEYPYEPYEFVDMQEIKSYEAKCETESLDSLYRRARCTVENYNDQDISKLTTLAADSVWTHFQDKFSTTHYIGVVGDNGSGKSTIGDTFEAIGYRVVNMTDPTAANLFRVLGIIEPGQCTLVADEAEKIDQSPEIMSTLKTGYQFKSKVARVNMNNLKQEFYYTYCFKMIIAERSPNETKAKGVLDRTFVFHTYHGKPKYDIKEILKPSGDPKRQSLLNDLNDFRKLLFVYRIIHFQDPIADIDIGLEGRHKELCKPVLQLFHNSQSLKEIEGAFQTCLNAKNQRKSNSIEAALHPIIVNLVSIKGNEVFAGQIWDLILEMIPGAHDDKKPNEYQTYDYGTIYRNTITNIICDKFGAERGRRKEGSVLTFDPEKLVRVGRLYNLETKIQTKMNVGGVGNVDNVGSEKEPSNLSHEEDVGNVGNVGYRKEQASPNLSGRYDVVPIEQTDGFPIDRRKDVGGVGNVSIRKEPQVSSDLSGKKDVGGVGNVGFTEDPNEFSNQSIRKDVGGVGNVGSRGDNPGMIENPTKEKNKEIVTIPPNRAQKLDQNNTNTNQSGNLLDCFWSDNTPKPSIEPTQPTSPTPDNNIILGAAITATTAGRIYRIHPHSDIFACENCRRKGDKWDMKDHQCRGNKK